MTRSISVLEDSYEGMEVYTAKIPNKNFQEIKLIEVSGGWPMGPKGLIDKLVQRAKNEGADGLINVQFSSADKGGHTVSGTAVKFD